MTEKRHILPSEKKRKHLIKIDSNTNPNYGKSPDERSVEELLSNGFIILDKPLGPTSHQVDSWVKKIFDIDRVGHHGTLDPNATGVLPVAINDATKALQALLIGGKEYIGIMKLHKDVEEKKIIEICKGFVGKISQIPPVRSAVKRVSRQREIYYFDIIQIKGREVLFKVGCESGTYVRTLAVDIGKKLKTGANLGELRRTKVAKFTEKDTVILQDVKDAFVFWNEEGIEKEIREVVIPMEQTLEHLPKIVIRDSAVDALCHGANLAVPGVVQIDSDIKKGDSAAVITLKGEGVALVNSVMSTEEIIQKDTGVCAELVRVLMKKNTYPSIWKKS